MGKSEGWVPLSLSYDELPEGVLKGLGYTREQAAAVVAASGNLGLPPPTLLCWVPYIIDRPFDIIFDTEGAVPHED